MTGNTTQSGQCQLMLSSLFADLWEAFPRSLIVLSCMSCTEQPWQLSRARCIETLYWPSLVTYPRFLNCAPRHESRGAERVARVTDSHLSECLVWVSEQSGTIFAISQDQRSLVPTRNYIVYTTTFNRLLTLRRSCLFRERLGALLI